MSDAVKRLKYRTNFDFYSIKGEEDPFLAVARTVVEWILQKEDRFQGSPIVEDLRGYRPFPRAWNYCMPKDYTGGDYGADRWPALACASIGAHGEACDRWIVEYDEPDASHEYRRWHTTICLDRIAADRCHVAIESICRQPADAADPIPDTIAAPALVRTIIDMPWFVAKVGSVQLLTKPNKMSVQTFEHFKSALTDPDRTIPLVLFSTGYDGNMPEQAKQLARRSLGNANVYVLDWSIEELRTLEQTLFKRGESSGEYACPKSSARIYMPNLDLADPHHSMTHESFNRDALQKMHPSKFAEMLAARFIVNENVRDIAHLYDDESEDEKFED